MARAAGAVECDGSELLCLDVLTEAEVSASGPVAIGGQFLVDGFQASSQGGIDWQFGPSTDLSRGKLEFDITGLLPTPGDEGSGGKVSLFSFCGIAPEDNYDLGVQKMPFDYHERHNFRYGMDNDGLEDNWDAAIITSQDFVECVGYSVSNWQPDETHHIIAGWGPEGLSLDIDGSYHCERWGNGDSFYPQNKTFVLGNRCQHYPNQEAVARFRNLRLWALGDGSPPPVMCGDKMCNGVEDCTLCIFDCAPCEDSGTGLDATADAATTISAVSLSPASGAGQSQTFDAIYRLSSGATGLRVVQLAVWDEVSPNVPSVLLAYEGGLFYNGTESCAPLENRVIAGQYGSLDCSRSSANVSGTDMTVQWSVQFVPETFAGEHGVYLDAKGGDPEVRLNWTRLGTYTVVAQADGGQDSSASADSSSADSSSEDSAPPGDSAETTVDSSGDDELDGAKTDASGKDASRPRPSSGNEDEGCSCRVGSKRGQGWEAGVLLLVAAMLRRGKVGGDLSRKGGQAVGKLEFHPARSMSVAWSPDSKTLTCALSDVTRRGECSVSVED